MKNVIKKVLVIGGGLGVGYILYNKFAKKKTLQTAKPNTPVETFEIPYTKDDIIRSASVNKNVPSYVAPYTQNITIRTSSGQMMEQAVTQKMIEDNPDLERFYSKNGYITSDQWQTARGNKGNRFPTGEAFF